MGRLEPGFQDRSEQGSADQSASSHHHAPDMEQYGKTVRPGPLRENESLQADTGSAERCNGPLW